VRTKIKQISLIGCLFLFLLVVIGSGLHLNPGGAFFAAASGTPLLIYLFHQRSVGGTAKEHPNSPSKSPLCAQRDVDAHGYDSRSSESETAARR
jgi:hypothetical protein